jgi:uracil-DNA glycosylase family 4
MEWLTHLLPIDQKIIKCKKCPRLVSWRQEVAITKRKAYQDEKYWGKPVPSFGAEKPKLFILGLAPGAHGANRTGRIFTGDSSGDWLYESLHRIGIAKLPTSKSINDGQKLTGTRIGCAVRCVPPDNKPTIEERDNCAPFLRNELISILPTTRAFVALGKFAWDSLIRELMAIGHKIPKCKFGHGIEIFYQHDGIKYLIIGSYHPSQQNTFTGKLTKSGLDEVLKKGGRFAQLI